MINKDKSKKTSHVHSEEVITLYQSLTKTVILMVVTAFTLVFVAVAWFVANSRVNSGTSQITTVFEPIKLAVLKTDKRQSAEIEHLTLNEFTEKLVVDGNEYYVASAETIALRLDRDGYEVSPGARGKVSFYIIPNGVDSSITLQIGLGAYGEDEKDNNTVKPIKDDMLVSLINGHILLFDDYLSDRGYTNWLFEKNNDSDGIYNNSITVDISGYSSGDIVPVDFYWIWPTRYENYVNDFEDLKITQDTLFVDDQAENMKDIGVGNGHRYSYIYLSDKNLSGGSENVFKNRSEAYDLADEYIGSNAQYLYLTIQTSASEETGGMME